MASSKLQTNLLAIQSWLEKWRMKATGSKSTHITFTTRRGTCSPVHINNVQIPQTEVVKYLGLHLDRRLTWHKHIFTKRKQLGIAFTKMYWLLGRKSKLSINNKLLIYKTILEPIWAYGIQLWRTGSASNMEILERFQSKLLRVITDASCYVTNRVIRKENPNGETRNQPLQPPLQQAPQRAPKQTSLIPTGTTRNKAIAKEFANRSAYQIQYVILVILILVIKV
jgi:hypothetical protein